MSSYLSIATVPAFLGLGGGVFGLLLTLALFGLVAVWFALIVFTYNDARKRIADPFLVGCATAASFFPLIGTLVYTILRPAEYLDDVKEREWDVRATQAQLRQVRAASCRKCGYPAEPDFLRCPSCRSRLREPCPSCDRPVGLGWKVCPYCEKTLIEPKRKPSSTRSRRASGGSPSKSGSRAQAARGRARKESGTGRPDAKKGAEVPATGGKGTRRSKRAGTPVGDGEKAINAGEEPVDNET